MGHDARRRLRRRGSRSRAAQRRRPVVLRREELITPNDNPLLRAAAPLLLLLGRLRVALLRASSGAADGAGRGRDPGVRARRARRGHLGRADARLPNTSCARPPTTSSRTSRARTGTSGRSTACSAASSASASAACASSRSLTGRRRIRRVNYALLELMHACLALGFQGIHRTSAGGAADLQQIQRNLYETLRRVKKANPELSPRWQGQTVAVHDVARAGAGLGRRARRRRPAARRSISCFASCCVGGESDVAAAPSLAVHPTSEIGIQRRVFRAPPPPPPPTAAGRAGSAPPSAPPLEVEERATSSSFACRTSPCSRPASADRPRRVQAAHRADRWPCSRRRPGTSRSSAIRTARRSAASASRRTIICPWSARRRWRSSSRRAALEAGPRLGGRQGGGRADRPERHARGTAEEPAGRSPDPRGASDEPQCDRTEHDGSGHDCDGLHPHRRDRSASSRSRCSSGSAVR